MLPLVGREAAADISLQLILPENLFGLLTLGIASHIPAEAMIPLPSATRMKS